MICLSLILFIALVFVKGVAIVENNVRFIVEIWNKENKTDICFGVLVAPQVVLMTSCSWFKNTVDVDLSKILMVLGDEERYIQEIRINNLTHELDSNKEPLILIISKIPFVSNIFPLSINGGDLIETCQEAVIKKYVSSSPSDDYDQDDTYTHMARDMNPLPYEACKRLSEDIVLHKNEFCAIEPTNHSLAYPKLSEGSPVLCDHHLTGLKLYSKNLVNLPNHTLHVYMRMSPYINWLSDLSDIQGSPVWVFLESEYEERMIIGTQLSLLLRNNSSTMSSWFVEAPKFLIKYFIHLFNLNYAFISDPEFYL